MKKCLLWFEEFSRVQMTLSVVICVHWGHGTMIEGLTTPHVMSWWILNLGSLLVWLRWLKKPMKHLSLWRIIEESLGTTFDGLMVLAHLKVVMLSLMTWWRLGTLYEDTCHILNFDLTLMGISHIDYDVSIVESSSSNLPLEKKEFWLFCCWKWS